MPAAPGTIGSRRENGTVIKTRNPALRYELTAKITRHYRKVSKVKTETKTKKTKKNTRNVEKQKIYMEVKT